MRSMFAALAAATLLAAPAFAKDQAPAGQYVVDKTHASIVWKGLHQGLAWYPGRFTSFDIQLTFDPADVTKSKVTATIDPKSIETDFAKTRPAGNTTDFNGELATGERFFNAGKFPQITFTSTADPPTATASARRLPRRQHQRRGRGSAAAASRNLHSGRAGVTRAAVDHFDPGDGVEHRRLITGCSGVDARGCLGTGYLRDQRVPPLGA